MPGVAVGVRGGGVLGVEGVGGVKGVGVRQDDDLMPAVERLTRRLGVSAREIGRVAVSAGPGGFTSVRIAVTTGKMIAEAVGAECVAVPSALVAAWRVLGAGGGVAVALGSKGEGVYLTRFDGEGGMVEGREATWETAGWGSFGVLVADRFLPPRFREEAGRRGVEVRGAEFDPGVCFAASEGLAGVEAGSLLPLYPREPEAVRKWREGRG